MYVCMYVQFLLASIHVGTTLHTDYKQKHVSRIICVIARVWYLKSAGFRNPQAPRSALNTL